jgi:hypothetical protein
VKGLFACTRNRGLAGSLLPFQAVEILGVPYSLFRHERLSSKQGLHSLHKTVHTGQKKMPPEGKENSSGGFIWIPSGKLGSFGTPEG